MKTSTAGLSKPEDVLYFPFKNNAEGNAVTIAIYDANGNEVYHEDATSVTQSTAHYFVMNFRDTDRKVTGAVMPNPLAAGNYTYYINVGANANPGTLLVSGSFTLT